MNSTIKLLQLDSEKVNDENFDLFEQANELSKKVGWNVVFEEVYSILSVFEHKLLWYAATSV